MIEEIESESDVLSRSQVTEFLNRDTERFKQELNNGKVAPPLDADQFEFVGTKMCVNTTKLALTSSYVALINHLKYKMKDYYVDEINFVHLKDSDENFWGDYGIHKLTVRKL